MKLFIGIISLLLAMSSSANDKPSFNNGVLTIPSVDSEGKSGLYQDVVFEFSEQEKWELRDVKLGVQVETQTQTDSSGAVKILHGIQNVEVIKTDSFPVQIFLKIEGEFTSGCGEIGQITHQFKNNKFEVFVYYSNDDKYSSGGLSCFQAFVSFEKIIALPIYSLKAGEYKINVNSLFPRTFSLSVDNEL